MARRSFADLSDDKRLLILETSALEFAAHGYEGASLNRIIGRCQMSKSSFYYYIDDKADLFAIVIDQATACLAAEIGFPDPARLGEKDFWSQVEAIFDRVVVIAELQPWYLAVGRLFYQEPAPGPGAAQLARAYSRVREWVESALTAGQHTGDIRTDVPFSLLAESVFALLQALDRWSLEHWESFSDRELSAAAHTQADFLRRMLSPGDVKP